MGCSCSLPSVVDFEKRESSRKSLNSTYTSSKSMFRRKPSEREQESVHHGLPIVNILELCHSVVAQSFEGSVDPIMVASIVIMESSGVVELNNIREDFQETAYGLGQMLFSTAQFLMHSGYTECHVEHPEDLYNPSVALYFISAYIDYLTKNKTTGSCEEFVVKGYHNGSLRMEEAPAEIWDIYLKARSQLLQLKEAMQCCDCEEIIHVVQPGETLEVIGRVCGVSVQAIMEVNPDVRASDCVQAGDCIEIPVKRILPRLYAVKSGDSIASIARKHDVSLYRLLAANTDIKNPSVIKSGWLLSIPGLKGNSAFGRRRNDLIQAGIEDGPFCLSSFTERYALRFEEVAVSGSVPAPDQPQGRSFSRVSRRKLLGSQKRTNPK